MSKGKLNTLVQENNMLEENYLVQKTLFVLGAM